MLGGASPLLAGVAGEAPASTVHATHVAAVAPIAYAAPLTYAAAPAAHIAYAPAPLTYAAAPAHITYAAPAPIAYAAPLSYAAGYSVNELFYTRKHFNCLNSIIIIFTQVAYNAEPIEQHGYKIAY